MIKVLIDTSIWSDILRKDYDSPHEETVSNFINTGRVVIIGAIRQELLSGIKNENSFKKLKKYLRSFEDVDLISEDYEIAADFYNKCRGKGVQGSHIDFLICAVAHRRNHIIFTADNDFKRFKKHLEIELF